MNEHLQLIDTDASLMELCSQLQGCAWLAVDTEFERVNTYYPELCLVQLCGNGTVGLIDALAITDLEPLYALLYAPAITKVFHAARQDFEIFFHLKGSVPAPLFDTQIAAALRGYDRHIGYANLVKEALDIELPKSQSFSNWKRRPLRPEQLHYAADDVIYLERLYELLQGKLAESGQLPQLEEQCLALNRPELYEPDPESMWRKIKIREVNNFSEQSLAVFKRLAAWRELTARRENRPRKWIIKDTTLVAIARECPADRNALSRMDGINAKVIKRYAGDLLRIATSESGR